MISNARLRIDETCAGLLPILEDQERKRAIFCSTSKREVTRGEVRAESLSIASQLQSAQKHLVFVLARNDIGTIISLLGAAAAGHAVALIDTSMPASKYNDLISAYHPEFILSSEDELHIEGYAAANALLMCGVRIYVSSHKNNQTEINTQLLILLSTSGTTGSQKFVRLSRASITTNAMQIAEALAISPASVGIAHLPTNYSYGLSVILSHFLIGASVLLIRDSLMSPTFWPLVAEGGGTHFPGVPFHYTALSRLGFENVPVSVKDFTQAGGKLDIRTQQKVHGAVTASGGRFYVMYGQTEAAPRITTLPSELLIDKLGSVGRALKGGRITIEADGNNASPDATGRVIYEGPNVMMGYAVTGSDLAQGDVSKGRLSTGDIGYLDADGYLYLTGRVQRFAKIAGLRIGLDEVEADLSEICLVACQDEGDKIGVYFDVEKETELKARVRSLALIYKIPSSAFILRLLAELPRKETGKLDYGRLREITDV